jgi:tRNA nucleotidyltransferase (CCA-adding enzyme)
VGTKTLKPTALSLSSAGLPAALLDLCRRLSGAGHHAWLVGGCVRDSLRAQLDGPAAPGSWRAKDWDVATDAMPEQVMKLFRRVIPTGVEHGTVTVLLAGMQAEVTTLRTEQGYRDGRRPDEVAFVRSIEEDLARRDFTVNAIAFAPEAEALIDPFGGLEDLRQRQLRAVGEPARRFAEDGLRVLRAARFVATLEFELDPGTADAIRPSLETYRQVSAERVREEWNKALGARAPSRAFAIMQQHGLLEITAPELAALATRTAANESLFALALRRLDHAPADVCLRLTALLRDVAVEPAAAAQLADALLQRLRYSNAQRKTVSHLLRMRDVPRTAELGAVELSAAELRRWLRAVGSDVYRDVCGLERVALRALDGAPGADPAEQRAREAALARLEQRAAAELERKPPLSLGELALDGKSLMAELRLSPGPHLGKLLGALLEQVLDQPELNTRERLLERARALSGLG